MTSRSGAFNVFSFFVVACPSAVRVVLLISDNLLMGLDKHDAMRDEMSSMHALM